MSTDITGATYARGKVTVSAGDYGYSRRLLGPDSICCGCRGYTSLGGRQSCCDSLMNENHGCGQACRRVQIEDNVWRPKYAQFPLDTIAFQDRGSKYPNGGGGFGVSNAAGMDINQDANYVAAKGDQRPMPHNVPYSNVGGGPGDLLPVKQLYTDAGAIAGASQGTTGAQEI